MTHAADLHSVEEAKEQRRPVAVVTGATGGMGRHIVTELSRDHLVYAIGRDDKHLAAFEEAENVVPVRSDLVAELLGNGIYDEPHTSVAETGSASLGTVLQEEYVDVLVHAAAIAEPHSVESATSTDWRVTMDLNLHVPAELTRQLLPALRDAHGTVIFINSGAGKTSYPDNVVYAASKHALYALADGLRIAEAHEGVRVTTIAPGPTDTPMLRHLREDEDYLPEQYIDAAEIARVVRTVVETDPSAQLTDVAVRPRIELANR